MVKDITFVWRRYALRWVLHKLEVIHRPLAKEIIISEQIILGFLSLSQQVKGEEQETLHTHVTLPLISRKNDGYQHRS